MGSWVGGDFFCETKVETKSLVFISKTKVETPREKRSIPQTNQDKRSCPHNDRFHIQSVNLIDRSTLVYQYIGPRAHLALGGNAAPGTGRSSLHCPVLEFRAPISRFQHPVSSLQSAFSSFWFPIPRFHIPCVISDGFGYDFLKDLITKGVHF